MSLIISIFVPTGIVLSGDSRTTGTLKQDAKDPKNPDKTITVQTKIVLSDFAEKVFSVFKRYGVGTYGEAIVNNLPIAHYIEQFEQENSKNPPKTTADLTDALLEYFKKLNTIIGLIVVGYDKNVPFVYEIEVLKNSIKRLNLYKENTIVYGITRGGDTNIVDRLMSENRFNPLFSLMNIQDAVDFSRHLIRSTIDQMRFEPRFATVGGDIDNLLITATASETKFLKRKVIECK